MLTRQDNNVSTGQKYYLDSLLPKPSVTHSIFNDLAISIATPVAALNSINSTLAAKPEAKTLRNTLDMMKVENENPRIGTGQYLADQTASLIGYGINPVMWGFGEIGGLASKGVGLAAEKIAPNAISVMMRKPLGSYLGESIGKWLPKEVGKEGEKKTLSAGLVSQKTMDAFGTFAGAGVPIAVADNFNNDTNSINLLGVARDSGKMGVMGIAIGSIPFSWGIVRAKINRAVGKEPSAEVSGNELQHALDNGHITLEEHKWYQDYLEVQKTPEDSEKIADLKSRASKIAANHGHKVDTANNQAQFDIISADAMRNLQNAVPDQLVAEIPEDYRKAVSDFLVHNELDKHGDNPASLDGVRGYVDFIQKKIDARSMRIAVADHIVDTHMTKGVKQNMPFSQKELFKHMRKAGFEQSHIDQLPVTIPENISGRLKVQEKINKLKKKIKKELLPNKQTLRRIEELEKSLPKIMTPKEELEHIRKTLLTDKGLTKNWNRSNAYHRLLDLSHVWHNARTLLDRVHLEMEYDSQEAFKTLADHVLKVVDSNMGRQAKPENVINYLKQRIEGIVYKKEPIKDYKAQAEVANHVPEDAETILSEQELQIKNSGAKDLSEEFYAASDKFKEFKSAVGVFKNYISCVLGGLSV